MADRYFARSASDRTDDWPFWFVADRERGGINVTGQVYEQVTGQWAAGGVFVGRASAEKLAAAANDDKGAA